MLIPAEDVVWTPTGILQRDEGPNGGTFQWRFELPEPLASWDVFAQWERARFTSMLTNLERGDVLLDVGTEQGWCNLAYADIVGPENMVLIEPTPEFWPNIRQTWQRNFYTRPLACYQGLIGDTTTDTRDLGVPYASGWPHCSDGLMIDRNRYQYLHDNDGVPQITIDELAARTGITPDAITIDIEGAELLALRGATHTLDEYHPLLWVSIHPDMSVRDYNITDTELHDFLDGFGYRRQHLATDHEEHWMFW